MNDILKGVANKDLRKLLKQARRRGWAVARRKNHLQLTWGAESIICSLTPSDYRSVANTRAQMRRTEENHVRGV